MLKRILKAVWGYLLGLGFGLWITVNNYLSISFTERKQTEQMWALPVLGWRAWEVLDDGTLTPMMREGQWPTTPFISTCQVSKHQAPAPGCHCGINCFHDPFHAFAYIHRNHLCLVGTVALRGHLEIHHDGVRGEEATILGLAKPNAKNPELIRRALLASEKYNVPLLSAEALENSAQKVAAYVPLEDRPRLSLFKTKVIFGSTLNSLIRRPWYALMRRCQTSSLWRKLAFALSPLLVLALAGIHYQVDNTIFEEVHLGIVLLAFMFSPFYLLVLEALITTSLMTYARVCGGVFWICTSIPYFQLLLLNYL